MGIFFRKDTEEPPKYDLSNTWFTLRCFHGGTWVERGDNDLYVNAKVHCVDYMDFDLFGKFELDCIAEKLKILQPVYYVYRKPKFTSLSNRLFRLMEDKDILNFCEDIEKDRIGDVYFLEAKRPCKMLKGTDETFVESSRGKEVPFIVEVEDGVECDLSGLPEAGKGYGGINIEVLSNDEDSYVKTGKSQQTPGSQPEAEPENENLQSFHEEMSGWQDILQNEDRFEEFFFSEGYGQQDQTEFDPNQQTMEQSSRVRREHREGKEPVQDDQRKSDVTGEAAYEDPSEPQPVVDDFEDEDYDQPLDDPPPLQTNGENGNLGYDEFAWYQDHTMNYDDSEDDSDSSKSEDMYSVHSDTDDEARSSGGREVVYKGPPDNDNCAFELGLTFLNKKLLKSLIIQYAVKNSRGIYLDKDERYRLRAKCKGRKGCPLILYARVKQGTTNFCINTLNMEHDCPMVFDHKWATSSFFAKKFVKLFRTQPILTMVVWVEAVKEYCGKTPSKSQFYRTKRKCLEFIRGSNKAQYNLLVDYVFELRRSNEGSTVMLMTEMVGESREFRRLYVCLKAIREGFLAGCRKVIGFDGCFLRSEEGGHILVAVGIDAENGMYPVAYAVVEAECKDSWNWFLKLVVEDLDIRDGIGWTFISDKQKGLQDAIENNVPNGEHRFCVRHLYTNFRGKHPGLNLKLILWGAAKSTVVANWTAQMEAMRLENAKAYEWLEAKPASQWSRSHFRDENKCDILLNNLCEAFNASIVEARDKPIICMLEKIRGYLMTRMDKKRESVLKWTTPFGPKICKIIERTKDATRHCQAFHAGDMMFEVMDGHGVKYAVNLPRRTCSCRRLDLTGLPCVHAITAIYSRGLDVEDYVHDCYSKATFCRAYPPVISPMPRPELWANKGTQPIDPPPHRKQPGRPKKSQRREANKPQPQGKKLGRQGILMTCSNCRQTGHNKRKCPLKKTSKGKGKSSIATAAEGRKKRGRKRKAEKVQ